MGIEYWFHVLDQDGDGLISMFDLETFYSEQVKLLTRENIEAVAFHNKLTEILDKLGAAIKLDPQVRVSVELFLIFSETKFWTVYYKVCVQKVCKKAYTFFGWNSKTEKYGHPIKKLLRSGITLGQLRRSREVAQPILDTFINMVKYYTSDNGEQSDPKPDEVESPWEQFAQEQYKALLEEGDDEDSSVQGVG